MTNQRWMVVDKHRTPVNAATDLGRTRADHECAVLNAEDSGDEFGPFRVVEDTVATDMHFSPSPCQEEDS